MMPQEAASAQDVACQSSAAVIASSPHFEHHSTWGSNVDCSCSILDADDDTGASTSPVRTVIPIVQPLPSAAPASAEGSCRLQPQPQRTHPKRRPSRGPVNAALLIDLLDAVLGGHEVDMAAALMLRHAASKGDITVKPPEFETRVRQVCGSEPDVSANLLQLLGDRERVAAPPRALGSECVQEQGLLHHAPQRQASEDGSEFDMVSSSSNVQDKIHASLASAASEWQWDAFALAEATSGYPLATLGFFLIQQAGLIDALGLSEHKLRRFLHAIEEGYPPNPYHSSTHAADVLQSMHMLLVHGGLLRQVGGSPLLHLGAYLAAIIHDYEHRGVNNAFLVASGDDLAMTYNDASPMENHHASAALRLLQQPRMNFVAGLSAPQKLSLRQTLVSMVLATDMTQHFQILSKFQAQLLPSGAAPPPLGSDPEHNDQRLVWLQVALKAADVGHLSASWDVHQRWVSVLEEEFFRQGDLEASRNMPVSALMDRAKPGISKSQVSFFGIVARPLFKALANGLPGAAAMLDGVEANCASWAELAAGPRTPQTPVSHAPAALLSFAPSPHTAHPSPRSGSHCSAECAQRTPRGGAGLRGGVDGGQDVEERGRRAQHVSVLAS